MKFPRNPFPRIASDAPTRKERAGTHTRTHFFHAQPHKHARPNRRQKRRPSPSARRKEERRSQPLTDNKRMPSCVCCLLRRACVACWCGATPPQYIPIHPVCIHIYILRMYRSSRRDDGREESTAIVVVVAASWEVPCFFRNKGRGF
ncbi:unnamed protein product [Ixodes pacificus]